MKPGESSPELLRRAFEVFDRVRASPPDVRDAILESDASLNNDLRAAVRELLAHDSPTGEFLGRPVSDTCIDLAAPLIESLTPARIGRYRVIRELGHGGFGRVYLAAQENPSRRVAVKVLRAGFSATDVRRLQFEAEALARLDHPAIARVYECAAVSPEDPSPFIAMEYVEGSTLELHARTLAFDDRCLLLEQVAEGMDHAHRRGVLHRDLASKNILVDVEGRARIIDFGLASTAARDHAAHTMTVAGTVLGTLRFMSPEQLSGQTRSIDTRSDLFSLGVIVFEILTGRHPFLDEGAEIGPALRAMLDAPPRRPSSVSPAFRGDAEAVLLKCVERDPDKRYQSASELGRDLKALRLGAPVTARTYSAAERAFAFARRHKRAVSAAAVAAGLVGISSMVALGSLRRAAQANDAAVNALDSVVTHVIAPLAPRVGTTEDRERLLASIERDVSLLANRAPADPRTARITGAFFAAQGDAFADRLNFKAALPCYSRAVEAYNRAMRLGDASVETAHAASLVLVKRGDSKRHTAQPGDADYLLALDIDTRLAARYPTDTRVLSNLFWSHWRLADSALHRPVSDHVEQADRVAHAMISLAPGEWRCLEAICRVLTRRGVELRIEGKLEESLGALTQAFTAAATLLDREPQSAMCLQLLIRSGCSLASVQLDLKRTDETTALLQRCEEAIGRLSTSVLDSENRMMYLEAIHVPLARLALARGDAAAALRHADAAVAGFTLTYSSERLAAELETHKLQALRTRLDALIALNMRDHLDQAINLLVQEAALAQQDAQACDAAQSWFREIETRALDMQRQTADR